MDVSSLRSLLSLEGLRLLDDVSSRLDTLGDAVGAVSALRREGHSPELVAAVLTQAKLRRRASEKFGEFAQSMLFTEAGLEQSTRLQVAALHAGRFRDARLTSVADLCCGIGGDALALATIGLEVLAVEADEVTAAIASFNLAPWDRARVVHDRAETVPTAGCDAIWADPARRDARGTRLPAEQWSPPLSSVLDIAGNRPAGIKVSPAIDRELIPPGIETQWVSVGRSTIEAVFWTGVLARDGVETSALVIGSHGAAELTGVPDNEPVPTSALGSYLYDPDGAVIRARLLGAVAEQLRGSTMSPGIAYLTSDELVQTPFAQGFRIVEELPFDVRTLQKALRTADIGTLEIKKRGADIDPALLRKKLRLSGNRSATLFVTRVNGRHRALLAERL